jgi:putative transposase
MRAVAGQLRAKFPRLAKLMDDARADVLAFTAFPNAHRLQIHSTNPLERLNAEIKRRTDVVGIFPNEAAIKRLVGALLPEQDDAWQWQRCCLQPEGLQSLVDNQAARLSAVISRAPKASTFEPVDLHRSERQGRAKRAQCRDEMRGQSR